MEGDFEEFFSDEIEAKDEKNRLANDYNAWLISIIGPNGMGAIRLPTDVGPIVPHWASGLSGAQYHRSLVKPEHLELLRKLHNLMVGLSQQLQAKKIKSSIDRILRDTGPEQRAMAKCDESIRKIIKVNRLHSDWAKPHNLSILLME